jgi:hypothetical protein
MALARILPNELHERIADFLDLRDVAKAAVTSRTMMETYGAICEEKTSDLVMEYFGSMDFVYTAFEKLKIEMESNFDKAAIVDVHGNDERSFGYVFRYQYDTDEEDDMDNDEFQEYFQKSDEGRFYTIVNDLLGDKHCDYGSRVLRSGGDILANFYVTLGPKGSHEIEVTVDRRCGTPTFEHIYKFEGIEFDPSKLEDDYSIISNENAHAFFVAWKMLGRRNDPLFADEILYMRENYMYEHDLY